MSDFEWTEARVNKFIKRLKHKKDWLNTRDVRSGNIAKASDYRRLMNLIADDVVAFDNRISPDSEHYKICFNLEEKDRLLEELENSSKSLILDPSLMSDPRMSDLPKKEFLNYAVTQRMQSYWKTMKAEWEEIYKALCRYQNGEKLEDIYSSNPSKFSSGEIKQSNKDKARRLYTKTNEYIQMYKALRTGWQEIKHIYSFTTHNDLFIEMISAHYYVSLFGVINLQQSKRRYRSEARKLSTISKFTQFIRSELERLSEESDSFSKEDWETLLKYYDKEPHGQGMEKAMIALIKIAKNDTKKNYFLDKLKEFYNAFSIVGGFPNCKSFDNFLECYETEETWSDNNPYSNYLIDLADGDPNLKYLIALSEGRGIREALRTSEDPRVRAAVREWDDAAKEMIKVEATIFRRKAEHPDR